VKQWLVNPYDRKVKESPAKFKTVFAIFDGFLPSLAVNQ
jgi:hypothetical protein